MTHPRWRSVEDPVLTLAFIASLELLRLSGSEALGLRALLPVSLAYYAFRGARVTAIISVVLIWGYLVFVFSLPGQLFYFPGDNSFRSLLWGGAILAVGLMLRWLGERNRRQLQLLNDREVQLVAITDHMADGLIILDEQGIIESLNLAAERLPRLRGHRQEHHGADARTPHASVHDGPTWSYLPASTGGGQRWRDTGGGGPAQGRHCYTGRVHH